jgi:hypothetical protein
LKVMLTLGFDLYLNRQHLLPWELCLRPNEYTKAHVVQRAA